MQLDVNSISSQELTSVWTEALSRMVSRRNDMVYPSMPVRRHSDSGKWRLNGEIVGRQDTVVSKPVVTFISEAAYYLNTKLLSDLDSMKSISSLNRRVQALQAEIQRRQSSSRLSQVHALHGTRIKLYL